MKKRVMQFMVVAAALLGLIGTTSSAWASGYKMSQSSAAYQLSGNGITWSSSGNCTNRYNSTCTSFEQINSGTVDGIISFRKATGCAINITGGTETGHASGTYSHWNGYKVDINPRTCVDNYIYAHYNFIGYRSGDGAPQYQSPGGNIYARESTHWDILYY